MTFARSKKSSSATVVAPVIIPYTPQPKQALLHKCAANEILYGGAAGPGKSSALRQEAFIWASRIPGLQVYLFRRTFPELERNHILPSLEAFPRAVATYHAQGRRWLFRNGSIIHFGHVQHDQDVFGYQGAEIHLLLIDELTTFSEFQYDYLRGRVRCTLDVPAQYRHKIPGIICASNPGGVGHEFVKRRWVDFAGPYELKRASDLEGGMLRCYIPGLLQDNAILLERDPQYVHRLDALPEPYRSAYKNGDWNIFIGQAFNFNRQHHVIKPLPIPDNAPLYMTFDWGYGKPFSLLWFWTDADGRLYLCNEWYGCLGGQQDVGLRRTDQEIAAGIKEREKRWGLDGRKITRYCDPTCFNKKPDYRGGGQGPSTAEEFSRLGINLIPGDPSRSLKIRQFHQRLAVPGDGEMPGLVVYDHCLDFIRTIPLLQQDPKNPEDVDTTAEDHCYDSCALICMARPLAQRQPISNKTNEDKRIDRLIHGNVNDIERHMVYESEMAHDHLINNDFGIEENEDRYER